MTQSLLSVTVIELRRQIATLEQRLKQDAANWKILWQGAQEEIERLKKEVEDLKCCKYPEHYLHCGEDYCSDLTRKERDK